jgi:hypothetical protein
LILSIFLKHEKNIPNGLPRILIQNVFDFGLEMLTLEIFSVHPNVRHIICSVIRAGSLVISSCLSLGYFVLSASILKLLNNCSNILLATAGQNDDTLKAISSQTSQDLLYELMSVEAALVCISALLWFCPEALVINEHYLDLVVDCLDMAFRAVKGKYQNKFRAHFRFRTLHVILLECYAWLPVGSFPVTCQQLFVEALRTFRDCITAGFECTGAVNCIEPDLRKFGISAISRTASTSSDSPLTEVLLMLRLENYAVALQKKESEAFLACFSKDLMDDNRRLFYSSDWHEPSTPCAFIDSRAIDGAISLIASTFSSQSNEFQEKAIELCSQILLQVQKSASSVGIFTSDDEKRRRDRHAAVSTKNTTTLLYRIVDSFPEVSYENQSLHDKERSTEWVGRICDKLYELLTHSQSDVRCIAASSIRKLCSKPMGSLMIEAISIKIIQAIKNTIDKRPDGLDSTSGYLIALALLWEISADKPTLLAAMSTV